MINRVIKRAILRYQSRGFLGVLFEFRLQFRRLMWVVDSMFSDSIYLGFSKSKGILLLAKKDFQPGEKIYDVTPVYYPLDQCSWEAVPVNDFIFVEAGMGSGFDNFINHSCSPNCYYKDSSLVALTRVQMGEEITFDYNTLVWDEISYHETLKVDESFTCHCGSPNCVKIIKGFRYLSPEERAVRMPYVSQYVKVKLDQEKRQFEKAQKAAQKSQNKHLNKYLRSTTIKKR